MLDNLIILLGDKSSDLGSLNRGAAISHFHSSLLYIVSLCFLNQLTCPSGKYVYIYFVHHDPVNFSSCMFISSEMNRSGSSGGGGVCPGLHSHETWVASSPCWHLLPMRVEIHQIPSIYHHPRLTQKRSFAVFPLFYRFPFKTSKPKTTIKCSLILGWGHKF